MMIISLTFGLSWTCLSFSFFLLCRYLLEPLVYFREKTSQNTTTKSNPYVRTCFTYENSHRWERLNLIISLLHSLITGMATIYSFWIYSPDIYEDLVHHLTIATYLTCAFSYGYFWYDLLDILSNKRGRDCWELLLHHTLTLIFFSFNIFRRLNIAYQMFALIAEVNSIFLHLRKLFQYYHISRDNLVVRLNMFVNILTFIFCRLVMLFYVTKFAYHDRYRIGNLNYCYVMFVLIPIMWIMNPVLFYRIFYTDFLKRYKKY